jgi:starch-binding outer membrane protein, SusD/RagB family
MRKYTIALAGLLAAGAACADNTIVNAENSPTTDALTGALTTAGVKTLSFGVLNQDRAIVSATGYWLFPEIYARDAYRIDSNEPRYVIETLGGPPDPGSFAAGGSAYTGAFTAIRAATSLLAALPGTPTSQISTAQNKTTAGLIQTMEALAYYRVVETRDTIGVPIQNLDPAIVNPLSCKSVVLNTIAAMLDSANASLTAAGAGGALPFTPPTGFTAYGRDYSKASNLILLNRGLKGKVDVYRGLQHTSPVAGAFTAAIAELTQALGGAAPGAVSPTTFQNGAYVTFVAGGTENTPNPVVDSKVGANPKVAAALQPGDARAAKIIPRTTLAGSGLTTSITYVGASTANSSNLVRPFAILRDEEVVLLRAQAYFEAGQFANGAADLNSVRTSYGLAAIPVPTDITTARTALLYEKRFSLFFEGPQRLVDLRAYGLLKAGVTPAELPGDPFTTAEPIPKAEADARGNNLTPVCQ